MVPLVWTPSSLLECGSGLGVGVFTDTCRAPVFIPHHAQVLPQRLGQGHCHGCPTGNSNTLLQCQVGRRSSEGFSAYICPWIRSELSKGVGSQKGGQGSTQEKEGKGPR